MSLIYCQPYPSIINNESDCPLPSDNDTLDNSYQDNGNADGDMLTKVLHLNVIFVLSLAGIVGNCLSAVVLRSDVERREALFLLQLLAIADTGYLLSAIFLYPLKHLLGQDNEQSYLTIKFFAFPLLKTFQAATIWLTVLAMAERYFYVQNPFRAKKIFTYFKRRILALSVFVAAALFMAPRFVENCVSVDLDICTNRTLTTLLIRDSFHNNQHYLNFYKFGAYILFLYLLPLLSLAFMNFRLVSAIKSSVQKKQLHSPDDSSSPVENSATLVLVIIVMVFIICQTPELVTKILVFVARQTFGAHLVPGIIFTISEILMVINSSVNFIIYVAFGRRFRDVLRHLLTCKGSDGNKNVGRQGPEKFPMMPKTKMNTKPARIHNVH